jgi:threonine dehydrogenase-like Zn-dependent dehydrogenase
MAYEETPRPEPGPGEVLVKVEAAGLCRTDIEVWENRLYHYKVGKAKLPVTPGHEWAGIVEELGAGAGGLEPGQRVTCETALGCGSCQLCLSGHQNICQSRIEMGIINRDGAMAEYVVTPRSTTHALGDLSPEVGAFVEPTSVAVYSASRAGITPADRVLVMGDGPIGLLLTQAARAYGARTVTTSGLSPTKLALAGELGADVTLNAAEDDVVDATREQTGGEGFDVVLEAVGAPELVQQALDAAAVRGRVVFTGSFVGALSSVDADLLVCKELQVAGTIGGGAHYAEAIELLRAGRVRVDRLITRRASLSEAPGVFESLAEGAGETLKVLFRP